MEKLLKNTIIEAYCLRHCCKDTPQRAVHAEGGAISINTKVKYEDTEITDARNHRQVDHAFFFQFGRPSNLVVCHNECYIVEYGILVRWVG